MSDPDDIFVITARDMVSRIISGGQTGVDRGALEAAIEAGMPYGGWVPRGRKTEGGPLPEKFVGLKQMGGGYRDRTIANIRDSQLTVVILTDDEIGPGTRLTIEYAEKLGRLHKVDLRHLGHDCYNHSGLPTVNGSLFWAISDAYQTHFRTPITMNVAGSRESTHPGIQEATRKFLLAFFGKR